MLHQHLNTPDEGGTGWVIYQHTYLIIDTLNFIQQALGAQSFGVILFEVDSLVVKGLQIGFLILLSPDFVEALLGFPPLLLLSFQSAEKDNLLQL